MLKKSTNNTFDKGLLMDFNPIVTPNNVLTNCLNGTIITFNGNEYALQNDMGNGRVETAYLPEGYIPMGTAELGGIIYIVSYNPLKGVCQIGSFPSPERNLTNDEFQEQITSLDISGFYKDKKDSYTYTDTIIKTQQRLILSDKFLYPGDKFQVSSINLLPDLNYISAYSNSENNSQYINPKYLKFSVISISEDGKIENLNDNLIWYPLQGESEESGTYYYIRNIQLGNTDEGKVDLDEYRSLVSSNYNIYQGNDKGNIGILAELECINTFSCGYNISQKINPSDDTKIRYSTKLYLNWTYDNPINSNKINLYGIKVRLYHDDDTLDRWQYIIIPCIYSVNGAINVGDFDICKYPNNVEFLNYNLNIPENLKYNLNKMGEFAVSTDQQEWIRQNQSWINNSMGWTGQASTPNSLKTLITQFFENNSKFIEQYLSPRQNNGEDSQIEIDLSSFNLSSEDIDRNPILHIEVTPLMPFGAIEYLKQSYQLDLNKVGTGKFTLNRYQYQNYSSGNIMNIGFETYPEENAEFRNLRVNVYEFTQDIYTRLVKEDTNSYLYNDGSVFDNCNTILRSNTEYWANGNSELLGHIICDVIKDEEPLYISENIGILPNSIQLNIPPEIFKSTSVAVEEVIENNIDLSVVKISFDYVKDNVTTTYSYYRLYYSNEVFNDIDLNKYNDFSKILYIDTINYTGSIRDDEFGSQLNDFSVTNYSLKQQDDIESNITFVSHKYYTVSQPIAKNITITNWSWYASIINNIQATIINTQSVIVGDISPLNPSNKGINISQQTQGVQGINYILLSVAEDMPFKYKYNHYDKVEYIFKLTPFTIKQYYMGGSGDDTYAWMNISTTKENSAGGSSNDQHVLITEKNTDTEYPSNVMPNSGGLPNVLQDMNDNEIDIAILPVYLFQVRSTGTEISLTYANETVHTSGNLGEGNNRVFTIVFALRDTISKLSLWGFTFNVNKPIFGIEINSLFPKFGPVTVSDSTLQQFINVFTSLFQRNYKKMPTSDQIEIYRTSYSFLIREIEVPILVDYTIDNELVLNNLKIAPKLSIKNLYYEQQTNITLKNIVSYLLNPTELLADHFNSPINIGKDIDGTPIEDAVLDSAIYYPNDQGKGIASEYICVPYLQSQLPENFQMRETYHSGIIGGDPRVFSLRDTKFFGSIAIQYSSEYEDVGANKGQYIRFFVDSLKDYV